MAESLLERETETFFTPTSYILTAEQRSSNKGFKQLFLLGDLCSGPPHGSFGQGKGPKDHPPSLRYRCLHTVSVYHTAWCLPSSRSSIGAGLFPGIGVSGSSWIRGAPKRSEPGGLEPFERSQATPLAVPPGRACGARLPPGGCGQ